MREAANEASVDYEDLMKEMNRSNDCHFNRANILIVDDEMINIEVVSLLLLNKQIPSQAALSGPEALQKIHERAALV